MMNPLSFVQIMRNPQQFMQQMLSNNPQLSNNQPLLNAIDSAKKGDAEQVENIARNICKSKGIDADELFNQLKRY